MLRARRILTQKLNRDPTVEEIAKESGFTVERVEALRARRGSGQPRDSRRRRREPVRRPDRRHPSDRPDDATAKQRSVELAEAMLRLNGMRRVLAMRFGLEGHTPKTLEEVGTDLGITRERVRQLESRALRELRSLRPACSSISRLDPPLGDGFDLVQTA